MAIYFDTLQQFQASGGLKSSTITAKQLLPAIVAHMQRMDRKFVLQINGRLPKSMDELLNEVFELSHLQQPFYTQHCANRHSRYINVSKNRVKIDFTLQYRMTREEEHWVIGEIQHILRSIIKPHMTVLEKIAVVHDYIVRTHQYEMQTNGSPFTVYTFMHEKQGVCMAYALLFEKMMEELAIPCYYVVGHADGEGDAGHAWNMVQLEGDWYHIDCTWDDVGGRTTHEIRYRYFLRSDEFMKRDHQWNLAHYPPCVSEKYAVLADLYDVTIADGILYFPHPKHAQLAMANLHDLKIQTVLPKRVQFCTALGKTIYMSNYSDQGSFYSYDLDTKEFTQLDAAQVKSIQLKEGCLTVQFTTKEPFIHRAQQKNATHQATTDFHTVELERYGTSFFGQYKGKAQPVAFVFGEDIRLEIEQPLKQASVDLLFGELVQLTVQAGKKSVIPSRLCVSKELATIQALEIITKTINEGESHYELQFSN